jgi:hypothetical protein
MDQESMAAFIADVIPERSVLNIVLPDADELALRAANGWREPATLQQCRERLGGTTEGSIVDPMGVRHAFSIAPWVNARGETPIDFRLRIKRRSTPPPFWGTMYLGVDQIEKPAASEHT